MDDGLSQGTVYSIAQDKKGFMWFGTLNGLNRFDGYEFKYFFQNKSTIRCLYVSRDGKLWVGSYSGMFSQFDYRTESFIKYQLTLPDSIKKINSEILSIAEDAEGDLWIATLGDGVYRFNPDLDEFTIYRHNEKDSSSISSNRVNVVIIDSKQQLWVGTDDAGLSRFVNDTETFVNFQHDGNIPTSLSHNTVTTIYEDSEHQLWIGTRGGGLNLWDESKKGFIHYRANSNRKNSIVSDNISTIMEEQPGILWLGTRFKGLNRFHIKSNYFEHFRSSITSKRSLTGNFIRSSFKDDEGSIWFGTHTNGLSRFDLARTYFNHYAYDQLYVDGLGEPSINGFAARDDNILWIAGTSLDKFDRITGKFTHFKENSMNKNSLIADLIMMMYIDDDEHLWIATQKKGLNNFDIKKNIFTHYHRSGNKGYQISSNEISSVTPYDEEHLWLGTYNVGIDLLNRKTGDVKNIRYVQGKSSSDVNKVVERYLLARRVYTVLTDSKKRNWVATTKGLFEIDVETMMLKEVNHHLLNSIVVSTLLEDVNGDLWLGTNENGLLRFKPESKSVYQYSQEQGLCDSTVYAVLEDNQGNIWVSTNNCLAMLDIKSLTFSIYDKNDGLQENEFNGNAAIKLPLGKLVFGGINGFNIFDPRNIKVDTRLPQVSLTELFIFNQPTGISTSLKERELLADKLVYLLDQSITYTDQVVLDYPFKMFGFSFAAQNYKNSLSTQYQYKLSPWDENWIPTSATKRVAQYSNLPAGEYIFSVKAGNKNGYWNEQATSIKVIILPPPWKTWWAISSYILCIIGMIIIAVRVQQNKIKIQNRELERERKVSKRLSEINELRDEFLANTSHELRTPLNGIIGIAESLLDGIAGNFNNEANENLSMIITSGKRLANLVNDILDFSKLKNHDLELKINNVELYSIVNIVVNLTKPLVTDKSLHIENTITPGLYVVEADENRLQQIIHNLIGNAVKFTETGGIRLSAVQFGEWITIRVSDTGIGVPVDKQESIFDSFEQAEGSIASEYGGTGLGLAVSKKLVELHGGRIYVETSSPEGSTFAFTLKPGNLTEFVDNTSIVKDDEKNFSDTHNNIIHTNKHREAIEIDNNNDFEINSNINSIDDLPGIEGESRFKVLIVDDEPINRKVLNNHLKGKNYQLQDVKDGFDALKVIEEQADFDMILLDIMMPKMSGYDVCERIRKTYTVNDLPIIFLTAKNQAEDKAQGFSVGANDFLTKPVNKLELLSRVKTHLKLLDINRNLEHIVGERTASLVEKTVDLEEKNQRIAVAHKLLIEQEKLAALGAIAGGVAHEINNPTNYLYYTSRHLEKDLNVFRKFIFSIIDDEGDQQVRNSFDKHFTPLFNHISILGEGTERLKTIVEDLKSFTRLDKSNFIVMLLAENIKTTINLVKVRYEEQVTIDMKVIDNITIRCCPTRIKQVFMNILINSCQAMEMDRKIEVDYCELDASTAVKKREAEVSRIDVFVSGKKDKGIVEIRDNSSGMPNSVLEHLFDPFYATKDLDASSELGMSNVENIIHEHGGTIEVQSELGMGTTFIVTFPLVEVMPTGM